MPGPVIPKIKDYYIFDLPAAQGVTPEKVAVNFTKRTAVKTNGPNSFVIFGGSSDGGVVVTWPGILDDMLNQF